jgi:hypothetical protein
LKMLEPESLTFGDGDRSALAPYLDQQRALTIRVQLNRVPFT